MAEHTTAGRTVSGAHWRPSSSIMPALQGTAAAKSQEARIRPTLETARNEGVGRRDDVMVGAFGIFRCDTAATVTGIEIATSGDVLVIPCKCAVISPARTQFGPDRRGGLHAP